MSRKIYFAGSIRAGRNDADLYARIVEVLRKYGKVLTEHVGDPNLTEKGDHALQMTYPIMYHTTAPISNCVYHIHHIQEMKL